MADANEIERLDPALDAIVPAGARIEKVAEGFRFTEGPVWTRDGVLLFSDIPNNVVLRWDPTTDAVSDYRRPSAESNGNTLDAQGRLVSCEHAGRRVSRQEADGSFSTLADRYEGKRLNSPNDVVYRSDGLLYFTDPPYGLPKGDTDPGKDLAWNGVYCLKGDSLILLADELTRPNGLAFSPDERLLYVANSDPELKFWKVYPVRSDGTLEPGEVFFDVTANREPGLPDGMKLDQAGNLYCTGPGGLWIFSAAGRHLGTLRAPEIPANCHWGDDGKTLYLTAQTGLYRIRLSIPGIRP